MAGPQQQIKSHVLRVLLHVVPSLLAPQCFFALDDQADMQELAHNKGPLKGLCGLFKTS